MTRHFCAVSIVVLCVIDAHAAWTRRYEAIPHVQRCAIAPLAKGGYVLAANTTIGLRNTPEEKNAIFVLDARGEVRAARELSEVQTDILTTGPAGEIFAGLRPVAKEAEERQLRVAKLRSDLSIAWVRRIEPVDGSVIHMNHAAATRDGGVVVSGLKNSATSVFVKLNAQGETEWATQIDPSGRERISFIQQLRDGGYVAGGDMEAGAWLIRIAADGSLRWQKTYEPNVFGLASAIEASDGSILTIGNHLNKPVILKVNGKSGEVVRARESSAAGLGLSLVSTADGAVATMTGGVETAKVHVVSMKDDGTVRWRRMLRLQGAMTNGFENAMLASQSDRVALAVAASRPPVVLEVDAASGESSCSWLSNEGIEFSDAALRTKEVPVEVLHPRFVSREATVKLATLSASAKNESCPAEAPAAASVVPTTATNPFRYDDHSAQKKQYAELLRAKKFVELAKIGDGLRSHPQSRDPLTPNQALYVFYEAFINNELVPESIRLPLLREWRSSQPSLTATIALARALHDSAWRARGGGYSSTVTETGAATFDAFMSETKKVLEDAGRVGGETDPQYWNLRISLARELGLEDVRELALRALGRHPDPAIAVNAVFSFRPQWGGTPEEYMKFTNAAVEATRSKYGTAMYMWLPYQVYDSEQYKPLQVDWKRMRQGFDDLLRIAPEWLPAFHRYARVTYDHKDQETARRLFQLPQLDWYAEAARTWGTRDYYEYVRHWALAPPAPPPPLAVPAPPSAPPPPQLDTKRWPATMLDTGFLVETPQGTFAISAAAATRLEPSAKRSVRPLQLRKEQDVNGPLYVIFCRRRGGARCVQTIVPAKKAGASWGNGPKRRTTYTIDVSEPLEPNEIAGAAVIDASGAVFAVAIEMSPESMRGATFLIRAIDVREMVEP